MEALTSLFSSKPPGDIRLDQINFYHGPRYTQRRDSTPTNGDEWPDIDQILAQHERNDSMEWNSDSGVHAMDQDLRTPIGTYARSTTFPLTRSEHGHAPPYTPSDRPQLQFGGNSMFADLLDVADESRDTATQPAFQGAAADMEDTARGYVSHQHAPLISNDAAKWERTRSGGSLLQSHPLSPAQDTDVQDLPTANSDLSVGSPNTPLKRSEPAQRNDGEDIIASSASEGVAVTREDHSLQVTAAAVTAFNADRPEAASDHTPSLGGDETDNASEDDCEEPYIPTARRRKWTGAQSSEQACPASIPRSISSSTKPRRTRGRHRLTRLRRRSKTRNNSSPPSGIQKRPETSLASISSEEMSDGWPVQCFLRRKLVGSQEVITIEFPTLHLYGSPCEIAAVPSLCEAAPAVVDCRGRKRRVRFLEEEEKLLIELKEQRQPRLSWNEIRKYFPSRTVGSLQVHYCTQLRGRSPAKLGARRSLGREK